MPAASDVTAIILHYNQPEMTARCCASLSRQTLPPARVLVVDNGSPDRDAERLRRDCPGTEILVLNRNLGFAAGVNAAIRSQATARSGALWLLNNDTECDPAVLERLHAVLAASPRCGAVAALLEETLPDGRVLRVAGGRFDPRRPGIPLVAGPGEAVDYLVGACLLIRAEALEEVGLLDEGYFFFFEDADWCRRARNQGWDLAVCEDAVVHHLRSGTIGALPRLQSAYYRRSHIRFLRAHTRFPFLLSSAAAVYRLCAQMWGRDWGGALGTFEGWWQGWREAFSRPPACADTPQYGHAAPPPPPRPMETNR